MSWLGSQKCMPKKSGVSDICVSLGTLSFSHPSFGVPILFIYFAMRSPLPFPCVPDRPYKILLAQVGTLSFSHPLFGVSVLFIRVGGRALGGDRHLSALLCFSLVRPWNSC